MKIKIKIRAIYFALLFFFLVFVVVLYANYTGVTDSNYITASEALLGLGFLAILVMLLGK